MLSALISRLIILVCGTLYPAYSSHKAVKTKNVKEYVKWMMYWIVFAFYTFAEVFTDIFVAFWMPCYYELKILFVLWLVCPATRGSTYLYKKIVHPYLLQNEDQIDAYLERMWDHAYEFCRRLGSQGFSYLVELLTDLVKKGQITVATKLPAILELAQETTRNVDSRVSTTHASTSAVDGGGVDFEDYDVVEPHEFSGGFPSSAEDTFGLPDSLPKSFPDTMNNNSDAEASSVESRPLRLRSSHSSKKEEPLPEEAVPVVSAKGGKVRQRRNAKK